MSVSNFQHGAKASLRNRAVLFVADVWVTKYLHEASRHPQSELSAVLPRFRTLPTVASGSKNGWLVDGKRRQWGGFFVVRLRTSVTCKSEFQEFSYSRKHGTFRNNPKHRIIITIIRKICTIKFSKNKFNKNKLVSTWKIKKTKKNKKKQNCNEWRLAT